MKTECGRGSFRLFFFLKMHLEIRRAFAAFERNSDPWRSRSSEWFVLRSTDSARTELGVERNDGIYRPRSIAFNRDRPDFHRAESLRLNAAKRGAAVAEHVCQPSEFFNQRFCHRRHTRPAQRAWCRAFDGELVGCGPCFATKTSGFRCKNSRRMIESTQTAEISAENVIADRCSGEFFSRTQTG